MRKRAANSNNRFAKNNNNKDQDEFHFFKDKFSNIQKSETSAC